MRFDEDAYTRHPKIFRLLIFWHPVYTAPRPGLIARDLGAIGKRCALIRTPYTRHPKILRSLIFWFPIYAAPKSGLIARGLGAIGKRCVLIKTHIRAIQHFFAR